MKRKHKTGVTIDLLVGWGALAQYLRASSEDKLREIKRNETKKIHLIEKKTNFYHDKNQEMI
jgi:hypothetical protein